MAKALDYSLQRWPALVSFLDDGRLPIDNNRSHADGGMGSVMTQRIPANTK